MKNIFKQEILIRWLAVTPGLALTGFQITRPRLMIACQVTLTEIEENQFYSLSSSGL